MHITQIDMAMVWSSSQIETSMRILGISLLHYLANKMVPASIQSYTIEIERLGMLGRYTNLPKVKKNT